MRRGSRNTVTGIVRSYVSRGGGLAPGCMAQQWGTREQDTMKAAKQTKAAVMATFGRLMEAWGAGDIDAAMACFAPDPDAVHIGSEADERMVGPAELRELLERALE